MELLITTVSMFAIFKEKEAWLAYSDAFGYTCEE